MAPPALYHPKLWPELVQRLAASQVPRAVWEAYAKPYLAAGTPWPTVPCTSLPAALKVFCVAASTVAPQVWNQRYLGGKTPAGNNRKETFDRTRHDRFLALWTPASTLFSTNEGQGRAIELINWYIDSWKNININDQKYHVWDPNPFEDWGWQSFQDDTRKYMETVSGPRFVEALRDLLVADWLTGASREAPREASPPPPTPPLKPLPVPRLPILEVTPMNPQYFTVVWGAMQPMLASVQPQTLGPFASPQAAQAAAQTLAGIWQQAGGYALAQANAYNPLTKMLSELARYTAAPQKPNWGGY